MSVKENVTARMGEVRSRFPRVMCRRNSTVRAARVRTACCSALEPVHGKHLFLTSKKKPAAFPAYLFAALTNSCKIAGSAPKLPCQQNGRGTAATAERSLQWRPFALNRSRGWAACVPNHAPAEHKALGAWRFGQSYATVLLGRGLLLFWLCDDWPKDWEGQVVPQLLQSGLAYGSCLLKTLHFLLK